MKKLVTVLIILLAATKLSAVNLYADSGKIQVQINDIDSLKQKLKLAANDSLKAPIYTQIAAEYLKFDTISNKKRRANYQTEAISNTLQALHVYSYYNDTTGLRTCFNNLATVYFAQHKYSQAKWFILQSNTISRIKKDTVNVITSLITLAAIKSNIKDYTLAMRDLNEALTMAAKKKDLKSQSVVLQNFAFLYSRLKNYPKEALVLKKRDSIELQILKNEQAGMVAKIASQDSVQRKKQDSVLVKKKVYTSSFKKLYKSGSPKKVVL
jgi:tetratricopeptide (TPR) repeat protein